MKRPKIKKIVSKKKFEESKSNLDVATKIAIENVEIGSIKKIISEKK